MKHIFRSAGILSIFPILILTSAALCEVSPTLTEGSTTRPAGAIEGAATTKPQADRPARRWGGALEIGGDYATNLALPRSASPVGQLSRDDDFRLNTGLKLKYTVPFDTSDLKVSYRLFNRVNEEHEILNSQSHTASLSHIWRASNRLRSTSGFDFSHYRFDERSYFDRFRARTETWLHETGPLWGRIGYSFACSDHHINEEFDSHAHTVSLDQRYYLGDIPAYITLGYTYTRELTEANRYNYHNHKVHFSGVWRIGGRHLLRPRLWAAFARYDGIDTIGGRRRQDDMYGATIRYDYQINQIWSVYAGCTWKENDSNLRRHDYDRTIIGIGTTIAF